MRGDILGALSSFLLVFSTAFPVLVPFLLVDNLGIATRLSNLVAIVMLFAIGFAWGRYAGVNRLWSGTVMVLIGLVIVVVVVALGG